MYMGCVVDVLMLRGVILYSWGSSTFIASAVMLVQFVVVIGFSNDRFICFGHKRLVPLTMSGPFHGLGGVVSCILPW